MLSNNLRGLYLHTVEATGSIPVPPINKIKGLRNQRRPFFVVLGHTWYALLALIFLSCAHMEASMNPFDSILGPTWYGKCVPSTMYALETLFEEGHQIRAVVKEIRPGYDHIQGQVRSDKGEWLYLVVYGRAIQLGLDEYPDLPVKKTITWRQLLAERIQADVRASR